MKRALWLCWWLTACGVAGEHGAAVFHVGDEWRNDRPIAVGSVFPAHANKNDLVRTQLAVTSATPDIVENLSTGSLRAQTEGQAVLQALDPVTKAFVDDVHFDVAKPVAVALTWWADAWLDPALQVPDKFALVTGSRYVVGLSVFDNKLHPLHHKGIASATCDKLQITPVGELLDVTATAVGACTGALTVHDADGKTSISRNYQVQVVEVPAITTVELKAVAVKTVQAKPTGTDAPPEVDAELSASSQQGTWWLLVTRAQLADGTRVFGPPTAWQESGAAGTHLLSPKTNGANWALLKPGEQVQVTATIGGVAQTLTLGP